MIDAGVHIGEIFLDKYRVDSILGHGGMGIVALCTHLALNERVAIKMLRRDVLGDADAVERFMREAQAASKLRSEYVARVTDVGRSASNVPYMVMEYLEGHDLCDLLEERGCLAVPWAVELTLQAAEALAEAHSIGIIHRDVKPANLFVTWRPDGSALVKVLDFGISKTQTTSPMQLTQTQSLLGTPAYMSPEQTRSARLVDARTDIWSLGTVLYEALEGRRPFEAESFSEMCVKVATEAPGAMRNAPPALQQVVLRCLEKMPEQRYASMAELGRDLVVFSQDPHQAQVLVERMARTLRRSHTTDGSGGIRELHSVDRRADLAAGLSNPGIVVLPPSPFAAAPAPAFGAPAPSPFAAPAPIAQRGEATEDNPGSLSRTYAVARPKRRNMWVVVAAALAATALGVVISLTRGMGDDPDTQSRAIAPAKPVAVEPPVVPATIPAVVVAPPATGSANAPVPTQEALAPAADPVRPATRPARPRPTRVTPPPRDPAADKTPCDHPGVFDESHARRRTPCPEATTAPTAGRENR